MSKKIGISAIAVVIITLMLMIRYVIKEDWLSSIGVPLVLLGVIRVIMLFDRDGKGGRQSPPKA